MSRARVVIESLSPQVDCGRFAAKRVLGDTVRVLADVFTDGHDLIAADLLYRLPGETRWQATPMRALGNDRYAGEFVPEMLGRYEFTVRAWVDPIASWCSALAKKAAAGSATELDLAQGTELIKAAARRAAPQVAQRLDAWAAAIATSDRPLQARLGAARDAAAQSLARAFPDTATVVQHSPALPVEVDRQRARFSSWYEMFPRSAGAAGRHGTLHDVQEHLPYVASMGFDVLYLPPIHPIGRRERKGPNNRPSASPADVGSPWAIGSAEGGHKAIHPELGTLDDFGRLVTRARDLGIEIALDIALQCSPDHPYLSQHPEWFLQRPDGSIQYAENPPKKYQDIYPFWFETPEWRALWAELKSIFEFWMGHGVRIFRVDNPHTKPFAFWEWLIAEIRARDPEIIFLAEAFTRPKLVYRLAKLGFTQSYNYFPWRNTKRELEEYFTELTSPPVADFFRPNLWPNTPDILTEFLQFGGRPAFILRLVLAATLGASFGLYGPAFELTEQRPREPGSEEYLDSEKYQLRSWDRHRPDSLSELIGRVNRIRREQPALHSDHGLRFHGIDNDLLLAYSKPAAPGGTAVLVIANLDPHHVQSGWTQLDLEALGVQPEKSFQVQDLLSGARFLWRGARNFIALDPARSPVHLFAVRHRVRSERDFDYFL